MQIRIANEADAQAIASLHAESWRTAYRGALSDAYLSGPIEAERLELWRSRFENPANNQFVAIAEIQRHPVGFVCAYGGQDQKWGTFVDNLHVIPRQKRQGIGARLMSEMASWSVKKFPGQGVYLWVLQTNAAAQRFYQRMGGENAGSDLWQPPDGSALPKIRFAWRDARELLIARAE